MAVWCHINETSNGSHGGIMLKEHRELLAAGHESHAFWGRGRDAADDSEFRFATDSEVRIDALQTRLDDRAGFHSKAATRRLLARLDEIRPDVVHLHNLHGYYVNIKMLFGWLASHESVRVEWTLHDCWAFTGHCSYFTMVKCEQWRSHCSYLKKCPQLREYPKTIGSGACKRNFEDKRRIFTSVPPERMTLITPSQWLAGLVAVSFLSSYPVEVRHNTIDKSVFKPTPSDFRERYGIGDRFMVLGVANPWTERKGLSDFVRLAGELDDRYAVVLVGLSERQIKELPERITRLPRTDTPRELAEAYTAADLYLTTSREETYGMTVAEAAACGTPVAVVDGTACMEASEGAERHVIAPDLSDLRATVVSCGGGCLIVAIGRTESREQLAAIYASADLLFNPTLEDNYPTVNLEAEACGTPVVTYDVGGCRETVSLSLSAAVSSYSHALGVMARVLRSSLRGRHERQLASPRIGGHADV